MDSRNYVDKRMEEAPLGHTEGYAKLSSLKKNVHLVQGDTMSRKI